MENAADDARQLLASVGKLESDPTGVDTFQRYVWQAKQAVRVWISSLNSDSDLEYVVCEQVEDITLIYSQSVRFLQLKTRNRGSWSISKMCTSGLDSLARSYKTARKHKCHEIATFELWLEGPISDASDTVKFTHDPTSASAATKKKIIKAGVPAAQIDDFLSRLQIRPNQPARPHIDAKAILEVSAIWPSLSGLEVAHLYEKLLQAATAAQEARATTELFAIYLGGQVDGPPIDGTHSTNATVNELQVLSRTRLLTITPVLPGEETTRILERIQQGSTLSALELKLESAGADAVTKTEAMTLRAEMEVERQLLIAARPDVEADLAQLASRVLLVANATARKIRQGGVTNPTLASRPANSISAELLSHPNTLGDLDRQGLFDRDGLKVYGFLAQLSDECRFRWGAE